MIDRPQLNFQVTTIALSPLAHGLMTGNYSRSNPPRNSMGRKYHIVESDWVKIERLLEVLVLIARRYGKSSAAISLNWVMCKGAVPLPSISTAGQVEDCVDALGWRLSYEDEKLLDEAGYENNVKITAGKLWGFGSLSVKMFIWSVFIGISAAGLFIYRR